MLPIKKVTLFKHGVGHFERGGNIQNDEVIELFFRGDNMNDVLKSLTVIDKGEGTISNISYEAEPEQRIASISVSGRAALSDLLSQAQGVRIRVKPRDGETVEGLLAGLETVTQHHDGMTTEIHYLTLINSEGGFFSFDALGLERLEFLDENLQRDLREYLDGTLETKKKNQKKLSIFAKGQGQRELAVSYLLPTPIWKTSYRLLLDDKKPLLQGWALVDNTLDEDWQNVELNLVAGLPVSFIHDLYSPRYQRRPEIKLKSQVLYAPPLLESAEFELETLDKDEDGSPLDDTEEIMGAAMMEGHPAAAGPPARATRAREAAAPLVNESSRARVETRESGALFEYRLEHPVSVARGQSALVPILQTSFKGKKVTVYNPEMREKNPMSAVWFHNNTGLTLESGPVTVFANNEYAGETLLKTLKPEQDQYLPYAVELGCTVNRDPRERDQQTHLIKIQHGTIHFYHYENHFVTYLIQNKTPHNLDFFLEHPFKPGWILVEPSRPAERTENVYRFHFTVKARHTERFRVVERVERSRDYLLRGVNKEKLGLWLSQNYFDPETTKALEGASQLMEQMTHLNHGIKTHEKELEDHFRNQERLRKNLQAMGNKPEERELRQRYVDELNAEEDRITKCRKTITHLQGQKSATENHISAKLNTISFETKLSSSGNQQAQAEEKGAESGEDGESA